MNFSAVASSAQRFTSSCSTPHSSGNSERIGEPPRADSRSEAYPREGFAEIPEKPSEPPHSRPSFILDSGAGSLFISLAFFIPFEGIKKANEIKREQAPLSKIKLGLECGGSDGFSGISANPSLGYASDLLSALGGSPILSEFPELCGVEQELVNRCADDATAEKFMQLMKAYENAAVASGSGFDMNPSPGNIKDGLITVSYTHLRAHE